MYPPPFKPKSRLSPVLTDLIEVRGWERRLEVFRWEDRLVAHEESTGLWWGTLDSRGRREAREFWRECVANERVARLFSRERGSLWKSNGATLTMAPQLTHVLVAHDNSGAIQFGEEEQWRPYEAVEPWGLHKPLATKPSIWSPRFHPNFARRRWGAIYAQQAVPHLPAPLHVLWPDGVTALPIRLVAATFALGWGDDLQKNSTSRVSALTLPQFWKAVLGGCGEGSFLSRAKELTSSRAKALMESPEVALPGNISLFTNPYYQQGRLFVSFVWQGPTATLRIEIEDKIHSAHERLEASLELRDWLSQFFPAREVESWFKR